MENKADGMDGSLILLKQGAEAVSQATLYTFEDLFRNCIDLDLRLPC